MRYVLYQNILHVVSAILFSDWRDPVTLPRNLFSNTLTENREICLDFVAGNLNGYEIQGAGFWQALIPDASISGSVFVAPSKLVRVRQRYTDKKLYVKSRSIQTPSTIVYREYRRLPWWNRPSGYDFTTIGGGGGGC